MRKVHEKSIILGIGIGMIITSIAGIIYSAGTTKELTREEIITLAKGYGLVEQAHLIKKDGIARDSDKENSSTTEKSTIPSTVSENTAANSTIKVENEGKKESEQKKEEKIEQRNITIVVEAGSSSTYVINTLFQKEVITSKEEFTKVLDSYDASKKIRTGTYMFKKNEDLNYIVETICKMR